MNIEINMRRSDFLAREVRDMRIANARSASALLGQMRDAGGFGASKLGAAHDIMKRMLADKRCTRFLSFPACVVATGLRGAIAEAIERGMFDVVITTCGTLDHDLARAWGGAYYAGSFAYDDAMLHRMRINRLGNVLVPNESYGTLLEKRMQPVLEALARQKGEWGGRELIHEFGKRLKDKRSILHQAARRNVPVYVPGITDGAFGSNLFIFSEGNRNFKINLLRDEKELSDVIFDSKRTGALMLGGGISKHHVIWWNQYKGGLDYAVGMTTAGEYDGSLSGARLHEAISWGKIKERARQVTVDGDATVLLPMLLAALYGGA